MADIVLKNKDGAEIPYTNVNSLRLKTTDGGEALFSIGGGGTDTSDATAKSADMLRGKTAYARGAKITGTIDSKGAQTYTPGDAAQEISAGVYLSGKQTIAAVPTQVKTVTANGVVTPDRGKYLSRVTVNVPVSEDAKLGIKNITANGNYNASSDGYDGYSSVTVNVSDTGIDTSDATAAASDLLSGKTAYARGSKIAGSMANNGAVNTSIDGLNTNSAAVPRGYTTGGTVTFDDAAITALLDAI